MAKAGALRALFRADHYRLNVGGGRVVKCNHGFSQVIVALPMPPSACTGRRTPSSRGPIEHQSSTNRAPIEEQ